jgi:IMP dehydrogenase
MLFSVKETIFYKMEEYKVMVMNGVVEGGFANKIAMLGLTFDDVLMVPAPSDVTPNTVSTKTELTPTLTLNIPILSAAMDTVTESRLAIRLAQLGGLGVVHKNMLIEQQAAEVKRVKDAPVDLGLNPNAAVDANGRLLVAGAVGVTNDTLDRVAAMVEAGVDAIVLDSAHGHSAGVLRKVTEVREAFPELNIIAGNIATSAGAAAMYDAGADVVKVGIGPGSICTTRVVAGTGVPQVTAIIEAATTAAQYGKTIVADGGIKWSGDIVKAIAAGGNAVMLGSMLAGTDETQGEVKEVNKMVPEGIEARTEYKGTLADVVFQLIGGLRSGMGYTGSASIKDLVEKGQFIQITNAGLIESHPHDVEITVAAPNYK